MYSLSVSRIDQHVSDNLVSVLEENLCFEFAINEINLLCSLLNVSDHY